AQPQTIPVATSSSSAPTLALPPFTTPSPYTTLFRSRPGAAGGFTVTASSTDAESGVASYTYPALGSGWTNTGGAYTFTNAAAAPSAGQTATPQNHAGLSSPVATVNDSADSTAPASSI